LSRNCLDGSGAFDPVLGVGLGQFVTFDGLQERQQSGCVRMSSESPYLHTTTGHLVHFYDDEASLHESVAEFIGTGLKADHSAVIIATEAHRRSFSQHLEARGHQVDRELDAGRLRMLDARALLGTFMRGGAPDPDAFEQLASGILDSVTRSNGGRPVRLYGEMVDVLCRDGSPEAAVEVERLWGRLGRRRPFRLFCGYLMDSFTKVDERVFASICAEHTDVLFPSAERNGHAHLRTISDDERRRKEAESFRHLVESVKDYAIYMLDPHGVVSSWNAGAERIKGYTAKEIVGAHFSRFYPREEIDSGKCEMELERAAIDGRFEDEGYRLRKDGTRFWANVVITALRDPEGTLVGYAKVTRDLTERRRAEDARVALAQAEYANRVKDDFLATVSHELRTPLSSIVGWASLLENRVTDPYVLRGIQTIRRNAQVQSRIIEDVLDVARIASGKLGLDRRSMDLAAVVRSTLEETRPVAEAKGLSLRLTLPESELPFFGDPTRLQQVLWNVLSNAMKFTPKGGTVEVTLERANESVRLRVVDTGIGIEPEFLPHVFERFRQADGSTSRRAGGLGLGLAIVHHLVELHGGRVEVESDGKDRGSTFTIVMPLSCVPTGGEDATLTPLPRSGSADGSLLRLQGVRVLVVEDEEDAREFVGALLVSRGASVRLTASAAEAYVSLDEGLPDVILSDIGMPDEDGYAFARRLRTFPRERGGVTPIVALTAYASARDRRRAIEAGYDYHLPKPVDTEELIRVLDRLAHEPSPRV
jgi:PAS domain S-box-containing protein